VTRGPPDIVAQSDGLRAYLDAALDCVIIVDASGRAIEVNREPLPICRRCAT
jgi:hypothetical protein